MKLWNKEFNFGGIHLHEIDKLSESGFLSLTVGQYQRFAIDGRRYRDTSLESGLVQGVLKIEHMGEKSTTSSIDIICCVLTIENAIGEGLADHAEKEHGRKTISFVSFPHAVCCCCGSCALDFFNIRQNGVDQ